MIIGVPKETFEGECRVALTPEATGKLVKYGLEVQIESNAGLKAGFTNKSYESKGGKIVSREVVFAKSDVICQVQTAGVHTENGANAVKELKSGQIVIGCADPLSGNDGLNKLVEKNITLFALELIPRTTRAQSMDVLSSQANLAGYRAMLLAATHMPKACPMFMTAAGTVKPAKVFIIGAGVAGLQAIATARRLGAVVSAFDVRPACREQVESLGAKFVQLEMDNASAEDKGGYAKAQSEEQQKKQQELMAQVISESDAVITTAAIPGRKAPMLIPEAVVKRMKPGSVIIDLAAARGGNCECSKPDEIVIAHEVKIVGPTNLPAEIAHDASQMFGNNVATFLKLLVQDKKVEINLEDDIIEATLVCRGGEVFPERVRSALGLKPREEVAETGKGKKS